MRGQQLGSVIAAAFGLIYVLVNTGPLSSGVALTLRVLGVIAFVGVLIALYRAPDRGVPASGRGLGRAYGLVVVAEVVALLAGAVGAQRANGRPAGGSRVGLLRRRSPLRCSGSRVSGFVLPLGWRCRHLVRCRGSHWAPIAVVSGVVPGALLLAAAWWGGHRTPPGALTPAGVGILTGK